MWVKGVGVMNVYEAAKARHSVRSYLDKSLEPEKVETLKQAVLKCNEQSGLNIQLCLDDPAAFDSFLARYGSFKNVKNYLALVGPKSESAEEACGYYGQRLVLLAQMLGLNTCWVGGTYSKKKSAVRLGANEKLYLVISLGYGETQGKARKSKPLNVLCKSDIPGELPAWFAAAMETALLAPTAMNHQKFLLTLAGNTVRAEALRGSYAKVDLGIVKYNFEIGAEAAGAHQGQDWQWA